MQWPSERLLRVSREAFWIALGQFVAAAGLIVGVRLLTAVLPPVAYGQLALGMTVALLAQQSIISPVANAALRFFGAAIDARQSTAFLRDVAALVRRATWIVIAGCALLIVAFVVAGRTSWIPLTVASVAFALLSGYSAALDGMQNASRQRAIVAWHNGIAPWLRFGAAVLVVSAAGPSGAAAMWGYAIAAALVLGSQSWFFRRHLVPQASTAAEPWSERMQRYAWPFGVWGIFSWAQMASDRWALQAFSTTEAVGVYAVLYQLGYYPLTLLSAWISQLAAPVMFNRAGAGTDAERVRAGARVAHVTVAVMLVMTCVGMLLAFALHRWIFSVLVARDYRYVSWLLPWALLGGGLFATGQVAALILLTGPESRPLLTPKIVTSVFGALLNVAGAYTFGVMGVVIANVLFSATYLVWIMIIGARSRS